MLHQISVQAFIERLMQNEEIFVLDVREETEYHTFNINGYLIPLGQISARIAEIPRDKPIVVHCRSGHRSQSAVALLQSLGFTSAFNLMGGILAWQATIGSPG